MSDTETQKLERKRPLYIPENALDNDDYISGIGKKELLIIIIALIAGVIISVSFFLYISDFLIFGIGAAFIEIGMTITLVRRNKYDNSLLDNLKYLLEYHKAQKKYVYEYFNVYEGRVDYGENTTENVSE